MSNREILENYVNKFKEGNIPLPLCEDYDYLNNLSLAISKLPAGLSNKSLSAITDCIYSAYQLGFLAGKG